MWVARKVGSASDEAVPSQQTGWFRRRRTEILLAPIVLVAVVLLWEGLVRWRDYPAFILPSPFLVLRRFIVVLLDGTLWYHASSTLWEIILGLALGMGTATVLGYLIAKSPRLERMLSPYLVAAQAVPVIAIAPLLIIWVRSPDLNKVLICALTVFFPTLINTVVGVRSIEPDLLALMQSLRATRWQILTKLEVPGALPIYFGGLKIGVTLAVIGAVVAEFIGANRGLGYLINLSRGILDTPLLFVALASLIVFAVLLYGLVSLLEHRLLAWRRIE
ncbi:MAG: ABC transporter permease [Anaerolineae bacterium]|nr:ABC transporter permease [Anaerolineae bacterium]MCB0254312.1 ABC transporter permease [Anaerolineae bacterium]